MKRFFPLFLILTMFLPGHVLAKTASGNIVMEFDLSHHPAGKEVKLWIPYPVSDQYQLITDIRTEGNFTESAVYTDREYKTPILYARWDKKTDSRHLTLSFHAIREEVKKGNFPEQEPCWNPGNFKKWLKPTNLGPITGPVKELADSITKGKTTVLAKARAIYDWTCENMYRDPTTKGCGRGDVCYLLRRPGGKCTDINSVFIALCRAAGIPAREIFGIRMGKKSVQDISKWQHCWAEFYLPGSGWIAVDPADVRKMMLKQNLSLDDAKTIEYRKYFWGGWDPYRVQLAVGRDLTLNPAQRGETLNTFGYPYAEVDNKALDWLDPKSFSYKFTFSQD